jgi:carbon starvation protein CstA
MNTLWVVVLGVLTIILAYNLYAKRIDREVIQSNSSFWCETPKTEPH